MKERWKQPSPTLLAVLLLASTSAPASAGFEQPISGHLVQKDQQYISERCGGLALSILAISEEGSSMAGQLTDIFNFFHVQSVASMERTQGMATNAANAKVLRSIEAFSHVYVEHMNASYVSSGQYLADPLIVDDLGSCSELRRN